MAAPATFRRDIRFIIATLAVLSIGPVFGNDLNVPVKVVDCQGNPLAGIPVTISQCVDCALTVTTGADGMASFSGGSYGCGQTPPLPGAVQYCFGAANAPCVITALINGVTLPTEGTGLLVGGVSVSPQAYICNTPSYNFCPTTQPCNTGGTFNAALVTISQPQDQCTSTSTPPPSTPPPAYDASGETCIAFFPQLYDSSTAGSVATIRALSVSFTNKQKDDTQNGVKLNSGSLAKTSTSSALFAPITKSQRWGWETRFNLALIRSSGYPATFTGTMYCGQNNAGGSISVTITSDSTMTYQITMAPGNNIVAEDVHIQAGCTSYGGRNVAFGTLNCKPGAGSASCNSQQYSVSGTTMSGTLVLNPSCSGNALYTIFHIGF